MAKLKNATKKSVTRARTLIIQSCGEPGPARFRACHTLETASLFPIKLKVAIINNTAVEARNVAIMVELRSVCTPSNMRFSSSTMNRTQAERAARLTG